MGTDYSDEFARRYVRARRLDDRSRAIWATALALHAPANEVDTVLDLGAGVGRYWPVLEDAWHPTRLVAVDRSEAMLRQAHARPGVVRVVGDVDAIPLCDGAFDLCFCSMILHYSQDAGRALRRAACLLRPGGYIVIRTGTHDTLPSFDFLRFFASALVAETRAMPSTEAVLGWVGGSGLEVLFAGVVATPPPGRARLASLVEVGRRGFPSLQIPGPVEFAAGLGRYAVWLLRGWLRGTRRSDEETLLVVARKPQ